MVRQESSSWNDAVPQTGDTFCEPSTFNSLRVKSPSRLAYPIIRLPFPPYEGVPPRIVGHSGLPVLTE